MAEFRAHNKSSAEKWAVQMAAMAAENKAREEEHQKLVKALGGARHMRRDERRILRWLDPLAPPSRTPDGRLAQKILSEVPDADVQKQRRLFTEAAGSA